MPRQRIPRARPVATNTDPRLAEVNRRFDTLVRALLSGKPYDRVELAAVRQRRAQLLAAAGSSGAEA